MEMVDLDAMPSVLQPVQTKKSVVGELQTLIPHVVYHALAHDSDLLGNVSVGENSRNDDFERMKEIRDRLVEERNA